MNKKEETVITEEIEEVANENIENVESTENTENAGSTENVEIPTNEKLYEYVKLLDENIVRTCLSTAVTYYQVIANDCATSKKIEYLNYDKSLNVFQKLNKNKIESKHKQIDAKIDEDFKSLLEQAQNDINYYTNLLKQINPNAFSESNNNENTDADIDIDNKEAAVESAPVENTTVENTPVESAPVENTTVENTPVESAPVENTTNE